MFRPRGRKSVEIWPKDAQLRKSTEARRHGSGKKPAMLEARAAVPGWGSLSGGMDRGPFSGEIE